MVRITYEQLQTVVNDLSSACRLSFQGRAKFTCRKFSEVSGVGFAHVQRTGAIFNPVKGEATWKFKNAEELFRILKVLRSDTTLNTFPKDHGDFNHSTVDFTFYEGDERAALFFTTGRRAIRITATDSCDGRTTDPYILEIVADGSLDSTDAAARQRLLTAYLRTPVLKAA
jgi:hypothetical protein